MLVAVGSGSHTKGEKYEDGNWSDIPDFPVDKAFSYYTVVFDGGNFYYFGGMEAGTARRLDSILRLNEATWTWSTAGQMNSARYSHGVILVENTFMVTGGAGYQRTMPNEACLLDNGQVTCEEKASGLQFYNPTLVYLVSNTFGLC